MAAAESDEEEVECDPDTDEDSSAVTAPAAKKRKQPRWDKVTPPGWRMEIRPARARSYMVLHGPSGERRYSFTKAWDAYGAALYSACLNERDGDCGECLLAWCDECTPTS